MRTLKFYGICAALLAAFFTGVWLGAFVLAKWLYQDDTAALDAPARLIPVVTEVTARADEGRSAQSREKAIREDAAAIEAECQLAAGGDWDKWKHDTAPYRKALKARIKDAREQPLHGLNTSQLVEVDPAENLDYLCDPERMNEFRRKMPVVAAHRWLQSQGIDLIFVPVPKLTEIYLEHFLSPCPPDGIIAPHVRQTLLELLQNHVEVIDIFPLFRELRDSDKENLYLVGDTHWGRRGMRVAAKRLSDRIERYRFGAQARYGMPIRASSPARQGGPQVTPGTSEQEGDGSSPGASRADRRTQEAENFPDDPRSPVLLIGHSYTRRFREVLIKELNLPVNSRIYEGGTTEFFADFVREPELLGHCRVVVWISTEQHLTHFKSMPATVMAALDKR
jgi:hypothetical protein